MHHMQKPIIICSMLCVALSTLAGEAIQPKEKTMLFNEKDLSGWKAYAKGGKDTSGLFTVKDGVIHCKGNPTGYLRTEKNYRNYRLHIEWRWPHDGGNSGVLLHMKEPDKVWPKSIECQLMSDNAADFFVIGGTDFKEHTGKGRLAKLGASKEKPLGEWNEYDIVCKDNGIFPVVNGKLMNVATETSVSAGKICLQSEGTPIQFRNIYLEPID